MIPEARTAPTLSVSLVLYESELQLLEATLASLAVALQHAFDAGALARASLTVLDNCSCATYAAALDTRLAVAADRWPKWAGFECLRSSINAGFGGGHNRALAGANSDYLLVLNPDVELASDALTVALQFMQAHTGVCALNPRAARLNGEPEYLCKRYPTVLDLLLRGGAPDWLQLRFQQRLKRYSYADTDPDLEREVMLLSGACLLCRGPDFHARNGFDEQYFMYFEDFDLSRRLAQGGRLWYLPAMRVVHHGGFAARKGRRHVGWFLRSAVRFFGRYGWRVL